MLSKPAESKRPELETKSVQGYELLNTEQERNQISSEVNARVYDKLKFLLQSQIIDDQSELGLKAFLQSLNKKNLDASDKIEDIEAQKTILFIVSKGSDLMEQTRQLQDRLMKIVTVLKRDLSRFSARLMLDKYTIFNDETVDCLKKQFDEVEIKIKPCISDEQTSKTTTSLDFNEQQDIGLEDIEMQLKQSSDRMNLQFAEKILDSLNQVYRKTCINYASKVNFELMDQCDNEAADSEAEIRLSAFRYLFLPFVALQRRLNKKRCQDRFLLLKEAHQRYKENTLKLQKYFEEFQALVKSSNQKSQFQKKELKAVSDSIFNQNFSDVLLKLEDIKSSLLKNHMQEEQRKNKAKSKNHNSQLAEQILFFSLLGQTDLLSGEKDIQDRTHQCQTLLSKCYDMLELVKQIGFFYLEYVQRKHQFKTALNLLKTTKQQCLEETKKEVTHVIIRERDKMHIERVESTRKNLDKFAISLFKQSFHCLLQAKEFQAVLYAISLSKTNLLQVLEIKPQSKQIARDKANRVMKKVYTWAHLEADEDLNQVFESNTYKSKNLAVRLKKQKDYFNKRAAKLKKLQGRFFLKEILDIKHKSWKQNWQFMSREKDQSLVYVFVQKVLKARLQDFTEQQMYQHRKQAIQNTFNLLNNTCLSVSCNATMIQLREVFPRKNVFDRHQKTFN